MRLNFRSVQTRLLVAAGIIGSIAVALIGYHAYDAALSRREAPPPTPSPASRLGLSVFDTPRELPEIRFSDADGHKLTLADFRGRTVLLNIWATWCVPCRKEMPALDRLQARLGSDRFLVVALSIDREGAPAVKRFYRDLGLEKLAIYVDPSGRGSQGLAIPGVPASLLIDRKGREVAREMGPAEWDGPEIAALIRRTIDGRSAQTSEPGR